MKRPKFVVYKAADGYRWRLVAANGRIVADSGEAYTRKPDAHRAIYTVKEIVKGMTRVPLPNITPSYLKAIEDARKPGYCIG